MPQQPLTIVSHQPLNQSASEPAFRQWYAAQAKRYDLNPDPDSAEQSYDYRSAFASGAKPDASGHWPSDFKKPGHPNEIVGGFNTRTGERVPGTPRLPEPELVRLGWDPQTAKRLAAMPEPSSITVADVQPLPAEPKQRTWGDTARDLLPTVGGTIGALAGGPVGSAIGGAAGSGYQQLAEHAAELPGALADIARNWRETPAMLRGAVRGGASGALEAGTDAAIQGASTVVGGALTRGAQKVATGLMQSALKPGIRSTLAAVKGGQTPPVVQTLLKEGVNVTPGGIAKLNSIIGATNDDIRAAVNGMQGSISPLRVASRLNDPARKFATQVNPQADLNAISDVGENFLAAHGAQNISPSAAQALKEGTYTALKEKAYGEVKTAAIEGEKALARGLKEELAREAQKSGIDLNALNAREGAAITARDAIAKRVAMVGNRDPAGLAWLAHSPVTFVMALAERSPAVKTLLARGLYQSAAKAAGVPAETIRWAIGAIASSQQEQE